jgi:hypothetical protein
MRRRSWLLVVIGVAASLLAGCGGAGWATWHPASDRWIEIVTPHFVIDTDLGQPRALSMAHALEDSRAALLASAWPGAKAPRGRTRVMLFARQRDLGRYAGGNNQRVVFTRPGFERLLAFTARRNDPRAALTLVRHAQRRSGVTPENLALQFAALAALTLPHPQRDPTLRLE